jgi:hypothetical protein
MIKTTANKIIARGNLVGKPGNNDSLLAAVCANRIAIRNAVNSRGKPRAKIKIIHNRKGYFALRKTVLSSAKTVSLRRSTALTAGTLRVFELHGFTSLWIYRMNSVSLRTKKLPGEKNSPGSFIIKELFHQEGGLLL